MIIVFVGILMSMVFMRVIMTMRCQNFFYEVYDEESCDKCIDCQLCLFECFRQDMDDGYGEHRSSSECYEEIEYDSIDLPETIEKQSN